MNLIDIFWGALILIGFFFALKYLKNTRHCEHNCSECKHPCRVRS